MQGVLWSTKLPIADETCKHHWGLHYSLAAHPASADTAIPALPSPPFPPAASFGAVRIFLPETSPPRSPENKGKIEIQPTVHSCDHPAERSPPAPPKHNAG